MVFYKWNDAEGRFAGFYYVCKCLYGSGLCDLAVILRNSVVLLTSVPMTTIVKDR